MNNLDTNHIIEDMINTLNDRTWRTRRQASDKLIKIGKPAILPLMTAIRQHAFTTFTLPEAVRALGGIGDVQAVDLLIEELENQNVQVVQEAIKGLGLIGSPQAIQPLINVFRRNWDDIETITARQEAESALAAIGQPAFPSLLAMLTDEDDNVREGGASALAELYDPQAIDPLINALQDKKHLVRAHAADALAKLGNKRAIKPLIVLLADDSWYVRTRAIFALGQLGGSSVFASLTNTLEDQDPRIRSAAVSVLGQLQDTRIHDVLLKVLSDPDGNVRSDAVLAFARSGDTRALSALSWIQQNDPGYSGVNRIKDTATYAIQCIQERHLKN
ncbi:HEAT repeat domain-containing protein [Tengunoibacter tsumagoiensis]|uniref:Phycocyanobilin lyase n=1 Tax=Tengunoibacter tsumagoiensis TaxID=2014871 RepID=A0A401ZYT6_9CHLR|nr:HEAT repeat domain-containing protein [Tengunoibacter tsumagoiensis]GCE12005.1 hypothetical protein KTT_18640 [Tengunoibacter tsumagoiensis]